MRLHMPRSTRVRARLCAVCSHACVYHDVTGTSPYLPSHLTDQTLITASRALRDAQLLKFLLILTTTHAQDFRDVLGDRAAGRLTLPIAYPRLSRLSMLVLLPAWSLFLCRFWEVQLIVSTVFCAFATYVGLRFYCSGGTAVEDGAAYRDYNVRSLDECATKMCG